MLLLNYNESFSLKSPYVCKLIERKKTFKFSVKLISNKMHEATFKLYSTQRNMLNAHTELLLQIIDGEWVILNAEKHFC